MKTVGDWFKAEGSFLYFIADLQLSQNIYRQRSPLLAAAVAGSFLTGKREDAPPPQLVSTVYYSQTIQTTLLVVTFHRCVLPPINALLN